MSWDRFSPSVLMVTVKNWGGRVPSMLVMVVRMADTTAGGA
jgi:hypothetical protein